jgi:magnesium-transporting ATPase (P-type)
VHEAIAACRAASVKIAMITGDHPETAAAIATEVGLRRADDLVLEGADLPLAEGELGALIDHDGIVIADGQQISPPQR